MIPLTQAIARCVEWGDYVRRPALSLLDANAYKEWFHFTVSTPALDAIINFSLAEDAASRAISARVACLVRTDAGWQGTFDAIPFSEVEAVPGRHRLRLGKNTLDFNGSAYQLSVELESGWSATLQLTPDSLPTQVNNVSFDQGAQIHWFLIPHLRATGRLRTPDGVHEILDASGYHDHNWGRFAWGGDFAWQWAVASLTDASGVRWTLTYDRLTNRARTHDRIRGLLLWRGAHMHRVFSSQHIRVRCDGRMKTRGTPVFPAIMGLLEHTSHCDVPKHVVIEAARSLDQLSVCFEAEQLCRILAPNDHDLQLTSINEVTGPVRITGLIGGEPIELHGRALFEFLGG